jgi:hypothetical protein
VIGLASSAQTNIISDGSIPSERGPSTSYDAQSGNVREVGRQVTPGREQDRASAQELCRTPQLEAIEECLEFQIFNGLGLAGAPQGKRRTGTKVL